MKLKGVKLKGLNDVEGWQSDQSDQVISDNEMNVQQGYVMCDV